MPSRPRTKTRSSRVRRDDKFASSIQDAIRRRLLGEDVRYARRPYKWSDEAYSRSRPFRRMYGGMEYAKDFRESRQPWNALQEKWDPTYKKFDHWRSQAIAKGGKSRAGRPIYNKYDQAKYRRSVATTYQKTVKPGLLRWAHRAKRAIKSKQKKAKLLRKEVKRTRRFARRHM